MKVYTILLDFSSLSSRPGGGMPFERPNNTNLRQESDVKYIDNTITILKSARQSGP